MKIIQLSAENIKRLIAVEIRPDGHLVQITGKNGQGKTSVLDSIWWALAGAKHIQSAPIRKGANVARIRLDMGDIIVTRTFSHEKDSQGFTTKLEVVGKVKGSPQAMLDSLLDSLAFDPLRFARMDPTEQFEALKKFAPDVDFDKIEADQSIDTANRKDINRRAKEARVIAEQIVIPENVPSESIDERALVTELADAGKHNADIQMRQENRRQVAEMISAKIRRAVDLRARAAEILLSADNADNEARELQQKLDAAPELPGPINVEELQTKIAEARKANEAVARRFKKQECERLADKLEADSKEITNRMLRREQGKLDAIAKAKLPIDSLAFGEGVVLLNGVPFDQASDAEQLKASCALAMAGNPQLRVIRVRDGSLLDETSLAVLAKIAEERDFQIWLERVTSGEPIGFTIENGRLAESSQESLLEAGS